MREQNLWIKGYRLTTAEILYHMPDYPELLQSYTWQDLDLAPEFPVLTAFLEFWEDNIHGALHSVNIGETPLVTPNELNIVGISCSIH